MNHQLNEVEAAVSDIITQAIEKGLFCPKNPADKLTEACALEKDKNDFVSRIAHKIIQGNDSCFFIDYGWSRALKFSRDKKTNRYVVYLSGVTSVDPETEAFVTHIVRYANERFSRLYELA